MHKKSLLSVAFALASVGVVLAGTQQVVQPAPVVTECPLSGVVNVGYASNYTSHGIVASHAMVGGDGVMPLSVDLAYKLNENESIVASLGYTVITSGHHFMQNLYGVQMPAPAFHNETNLNLGWQNKGLAEGLTLTAGWELTHGGLDGFFAKYSGKAPSFRAHSVTQSFYVNANYDINKNCFVGADLSYAFQGLTGWWIEPYVGYKTELCSCADLVLTAGTSVSAGIMDSMLPNANGAQSWWIKAEAPFKVGVENLTVSPFISLNWAGCGALKFNKQLPEGWKPYKNFGVVVGVQASYAF